MISYRRRNRRRRKVRATRSTVEKRLAFIRANLGLDYELQYSSAYSYPCKIVSRGGSHDESQRMRTSEALEWCNGLINGYFAMQKKKSPLMVRSDK